MVSSVSEKISGEVSEDVLVQHATQLLSRQWHVSLSEASASMREVAAMLGMDVGVLAALVAAASRDAEQPPRLRLAGTDETPVGRRALERVVDEPVRGRASVHLRAPTYASSGWVVRRAAHG